MDLLSPDTLASSDKSFCHSSGTSDDFDTFSDPRFALCVEPLKKCFAVRGGAKADFRCPFVYTFLIDRAFAPIFLHAHCSNMLLQKGLKTCFFSDHLATKLATKSGPFQPLFYAFEDSGKQNKKTRKPL